MSEHSAPQAMDKTQQHVQDVIGPSDLVLTEEEIALQQKKEQQKQTNKTRKARIALLKKTHTFHKSTGQRIYLLIQDPVTEGYTSYMSPGGHKWPPHHRKIKVRSFPRMIEHTTAEFDSLPQDRWGIRKQLRKPSMHWKTKQKLDRQKKRDAEAAEQAAQDAIQEADEDAQNTAQETAQQVAPVTQRAVRTIQQTSQQLFTRGIQRQKTITNSSLRSHREDCNALAPNKTDTPQPYIHHEFAPLLGEQPVKHGNFTPKH
ncbi:hypothetical protein F5X98DRAFT_359713 [Xylaria grammica]|nr:hypothetical protein F5X98DRAFT_359713 [Xylaria grammica]